jgi:Protein of unknown function (DUF3631)
VLTKEYPEIDVLRRKAKRWVQDNCAAIRDAIPRLPDIENRSLDNYEPLFKIAHVAGGDWPQLINNAALTLLGGDNLVNQQSRSIELLKDIKSIFDGDPENAVAPWDGDRITSADLVLNLVAKEERPWSEYNKGKSITKSQIARLLNDFGIYSRKIRTEDKTLQGYLASQFEEAFDRYLPAKKPQDPPFAENDVEHRNSTCKYNDLGQKSEPEQSTCVPLCESYLSIEKDKQCSTVPVENSEIAGLDASSRINGNGLDPNCAFPGETNEEFWTRKKAEVAARNASRS